MHLSIILPAFNESENMPHILERVRGAMVARQWDYEVLVVDDGSTDETAAAAEQAGHNMPLTVIRHPINRGYGAALRSGFAHATMEWIFFMDSDGQFDIEQIDRLAAHCANADFIIGYRARRQDHPIRLLNAWIFNTAVRLLFGLRARDIDCAFKLMRHAMLERIPLNAEGALINTELLIGARKMRARIIEVPVLHFPRRHGSPTGARPSVVLRAMRELMQLRFFGRISNH